MAGPQRLERARSALGEGGGGAEAGGEQERPERLWRRVAEPTGHAVHTSRTRPGHVPDAPSGSLRAPGAERLVGGAEQALRGGEGGGVVEAGRALELRQAHAAHECVRRRAEPPAVPSALRRRERGGLCKPEARVGEGVDASEKVVARVGAARLRRLLKEILKKFMSVSYAAVSLMISNKLTLGYTITNIDKTKITNKQEKKSPIKILLLYLFYLARHNPFLQTRTRWRRRRSCTPWPRRTRSCTDFASLMMSRRSNSSGIS